MRYLLHPFALISEAAVVAGIAISRAEWVVLGAIAWLATAAWLGMTEVRSRAARPVDSVSNNNRSRLLPIQRAHDEIERIVASSGDNPAVKVVGAESLTESKRILDQAVLLLAKRDQLLAALAGRERAQLEVGQLREKIERSGSEEERAALSEALEARSMESAHYAEAEIGLGGIDRRLVQAESALAEMRARLAVAAARPDQATGTSSELEETLGRLRSLAASLDEAQELTVGGKG